MNEPIHRLAHAEPVVWPPVGRGDAAVARGMEPADAVARLLQGNALSLGEYLRGGPDSEQASRFETARQVLLEVLSHPTESNLRALTDFAGHVRDSAGIDAEGAARQQARVLGDLCHEGLIGTGQLSQLMATLGESAATRWVASLCSDSAALSATGLTALLRDAAQSHGFELAALVVTANADPLADQHLGAPENRAAGMRQLMQTAQANDPYESTRSWVADTAAQRESDRLLAQAALTGTARLASFDAASFQGFVTQSGRSSADLADDALLNLFAALPMARDARAALALRLLRRRGSRRRNPVALRAAAARAQMAALLDTLTDSALGAKADDVDWALTDFFLADVLPPSVDQAQFDAIDDELSVWVERQTGLDSMSPGMGGELVSRVLSAIAGAARGHQAEGEIAFAQSLRVGERTAKLCATVLSRALSGTPIIRTGSAREASRQANWPHWALGASPSNVQAGEAADGPSPHQLAIYYYNALMQRARGGAMASEHTQVFYDRFARLFAILDPPGGVPRPFPIP